MDKALKQKLVGAAVLIALAVIFIPMLLDGGKKDEPTTMQIEVPQKPVYEIPNRLAPVPPQPQVSETLPPPADPSGPTSLGAIPSPSTLATTPPTVSVTGVPATGAPAVTATTKPMPSSPPPVETKADTSKPTTTATAPSSPSATPAPAAPTVATAPKTPPRAEAVGAPGSGAGFVVQVGSFSKADNADSVKSKLAAAGFPAFVETVGAGGKQIYRVKVGPRPSREAADDLRQKLIDTQKMEGIIVTHP